MVTIIGRLKDWKIGNRVVGCCLFFFCLALFAEIIMDENERATITQPASSNLSLVRGFVTFLACWTFKFSLRRQWRTLLNH